MTHRSDRHKAVESWQKAHEARNLSGMLDAHDQYKDTIGALGLVSRMRARHMFIKSFQVFLEETVQVARSTDQLPAQTSGQKSLHAATGAVALSAHTPESWEIPSSGDSETPLD